MSLECVIKDITFSKPDGDWRIVSVAVDKPTWARIGTFVNRGADWRRRRDHSLSVSGNCLADLRKGQSVMISGTWEVKEKYGTSLVANSAHEIQAQGLPGVRVCVCVWDEHVVCVRVCVWGCVGWGVGRGGAGAGLWGLGLGVGWA